MLAAAQREETMKSESVFGKVCSERDGRGRSALVLRARE